MENFLVENKWVSLTQVDSILTSNTKVTLSDGVKKKILKCRKYLDDKLNTNNQLIYGINTGFGSLCNTPISNDKLAVLQRNLVLSHACGLGEEVPIIIVKRMLLLKVLGLSHGSSGVQLLTIERLLYFFNNDIIPVVYQQGSLGASGDLSPLAHMSLPLIGEGDVYYKGEKRTTSDVLTEINLDPIVLKSKEGLALLNGTQFMSSYASYCISKSLKLWSQFNLISSLSIDAYDCHLNPFNSNVNKIRYQKGQFEVAENIRNILAGSEMIVRDT